MEYKEYHIDGSLVLPVEKKQLYRSGKLKSEFFIVNYKKEGEYKEYYETNDVRGSLKIICNYVDGEIHGEYKRYFKSEGNNEQLEEIYYYVNGKRNGEYKSYNDDGTIDAIFNYVNDKIHGDYKYYGVNASNETILLEHHQYSNGYLNGKSIKYNYPDDSTNQQISIISNYINGVLDGEYKEFYENGSLKIVCNYFDGKKF